MSKKNKHISRRKFLGQASCAAIGTSTLFSSLINLKALNAAAIDNSMLSSNYKAMVCLLLGGGNDSFNMLIPRGTSEYGQYAITRSNLAIPQNDILPISALNPDGQLYGVHPSMTNMQSLFSGGNLAFITNIGTLIEPTSKAQFQSGVHPLPLGLFSHSDQTQQWMTGRPHERSAIGWGGRIADLVQSMNTNENISLNISLSGTNVFQQGNGTIEYTISSEGALGILGYEPDGWIYDQLRTEALDNMMGAAYQDIYKKTYVNTIKNSQLATIEFNEAIENTSDLATEFSPSELSQQFRMVAKTMQAREDLGFCRQIFFINFDGWDHHDELTLAQEAMLTEVDNALGEFNNAMTELGLQNDVTTFTVSDFGRTLTSNGNGTDHAWGGNVLVMGGDVNGGDIYGQYPSLELNNPLEVGGGVLIPTLSADQYFSELGQWFGVSNSDLNTIFPNVANFSDLDSGAPIGFMNI
ncbi:MAG: DUF1501 domain-containing protein [Bacteroidota bacterium]